MGKIIVKQAQVQQFQNIGEGGKPSIRQLFGRMRDPTAGAWQKINAGLGLAGKAGALAGTVLTTANQLQGGQVTAPLGMGYTYAGLDPTGGMLGQSGNVTPAEQQAAVRQKDLEQSQAQGIENLTTVGLDAAALASGQQQPTQQQINDLNALQATQVNPRQAQLEQARAAQAAAQPTQVTNVGGGQLGPPPTQATTQVTTQATQPTTQQTQATTQASPGQIPPTQMAGILPGVNQAPAAPAPAPAQPAPAQPAPQYSVGPQNRTGFVGTSANTGKTGPPPATPQSDGYDLQTYASKIGPTVNTGGEYGNIFPIGPTSMSPPAAAPVDPIDYAKIDAMQMPNTDVQMQDLAAQYPNVSPEDLQAHIRDMQERKARSAVYHMNNPVRKPITYNKSFVDMMFNEFGDLFQKQDPDTVAAIITGVYLDKMVR